MKSLAEVAEERRRLEARTGLPELGLTLWFIAWLVGDGPAVSGVLEELEAKAHDMLRERAMGYYDQGKSPSSEERAAQGQAEG